MVAGVFALGAHQRADARQHAFGQVLGHDLGNQAARGRVPRPRENVNHRAAFDDAPGINHSDAVGHLLDDLHLMGNQHHGQAKLLVDLFEQAEDGTRGFRI